MNTSGPYGGFSQDVPLNAMGAVSKLFNKLDDLPIPRGWDSHLGQIVENARHASDTEHTSHLDQSALETFLGRHAGSPSPEGRRMRDNPMGRHAAGPPTGRHAGNAADEGRGRHAGPPAVEGRHERSPGGAHAPKGLP